MSKVYTVLSSLKLSKKITVHQIKVIERCDCQLCMIHQHILHYSGYGPDIAIFHIDLDGARQVSW